MKNNKRKMSLEFAQIAWVVPDIHATIKFFAESMNIKGFPKPELVKAQDLQMKYRGEVVPAEWLTSQTFNGSSFIELVQPLSGQSMFHDYMATHPSGGVQHIAYRLPVEGFEKAVADMRAQGYAVISEVHHPIASMLFFDTYDAMGVVTEIMGITPDGWAAVEKMEQSDENSK